MTNCNHEKSNDKMVHRNTAAYIMLNLDMAIMAVPVIMILWLEIGLSFNEILLLHHNRKTIIIAGQLLLALAMACYYIADNFWWCMAAEVSFGIGQAVISGSLEAMLYDSLVEHGKQDQLQSIVRKERMISFSSAVLLGPTGGIIGSIDLRLPFLILTAIEIVITLMAIIYLSEPGRIRAESTGEATVRALKKLKNPTLVGIVIFSISASVSSIVFWGYQKMFVDELSFTPLMMGWLMASLNLIAAISSKMSKKLENKASLNTLAGFVAIDLI
ncbi:MAG: MFS transporter, partial [Candidatus Hodarchaeales archaeon]